jgi:glycosyltransferase involved in cell wall biosynthesis
MLARMLARQALKVSYRIFFQMLSMFQGGEVFGERQQIDAAPVTVPVTVPTPAPTPAPAAGIQDIQDLQFSVMTIENMDIKDINNTTLSTPRRARVLFCGTYYKLYSGYARVVYELLRRAVKNTSFTDTVDLTLYGFQNIKTNNVPREDIQGLTVYDAMEFEDPKRNGFGEKEIGDYLLKNSFDIVVIYNDMSVVSMLMQNIVDKVPEDKRKQIKFVCYIDQVYQFQKERYIQLLNQEFSAIIAFTDYWKTFIKTQVRSDMPVYTLPHGVDTDCYYPLPKLIARKFYSIDSEAFVFVNVNRNQPRKRIDLMCMAFAEVAKRHQELIKKGKDNSKVRDIKFLMGCALQGVWDIPEILSWEFKRRNLNPELINKYIVAVSRPQQLTDTEINVLYNAADVNISVSAGEGFGLSPIESGCCGVPSVAADVGGHKEFLTSETSILVKPSFEIYVDNSTDAIGGLAQMCNPTDVADAMWKLYQNQKMVARLGTASRTEFVRHFSWDVMSDRLCKIVQHIAKK